MSASESGVERRSEARRVASATDGFEIGGAPPPMRPERDDLFTE